MSIFLSRWLANVYIPIFMDFPFFDKTNFVSGPRMDTAHEEGHFLPTQQRVLNDISTRRYRAVTCKCSYATGHLPGYGESNQPIRFQYTLASKNLAELSGNGEVLTGNTGNSDPAGLYPHRRYWRSLLNCIVPSTHNQNLLSKRLFLIEGFDL
jgi:hypothetical protein